jgi:hypothetical protein
LERQAFDYADLEAAMLAVESGVVAESSWVIGHEEGCGGA